MGSSSTISAIALCWVDCLERTGCNKECVWFLGLDGGEEEQGKSRNGSGESSSLLVSLLLWTFLLEDAFRLSFENTILIFSTKLLPFLLDAVLLITCCEWCWFPPIITLPSSNMMVARWSPALLFKKPRDTIRKRNTQSGEK